MQLFRPFLFLFVFITTYIHADSNPIPDNPQAEREMAQSLRSEIEAEIANTKSVQAQRVGNDMVMAGVAVAAQAVAAKSVPSIKVTPVPNEEMKKRTITIQQSEKDRYEKPTF